MSSCQFRSTTRPISSVARRLQHTQIACVAGGLLVAIDACTQNVVEEILCDRDNFPEQVLEHFVLLHNFRLLHDPLQNVELCLVLDK